MDVRQVAPQAEEAAYHAKDAVAPAVKAASVTTIAGLFVASVQATLTKQNIGLMGTLTRYGGTVATFGAMGGTYEFARIAAANLRETQDSYNEAIGGFFSGAMLGLRFRSFPAVLGYGSTLAVILAAFNYTGGSLGGYNINVEVDEYERKEFLRRNRRRPISETVEELGEGRGIFGPGYDERRRQRIQEKYGIDVKSGPS